jgi:hypothetical protein
MSVLLNSKKPVPELRDTAGKSGIWRDERHAFKWVSRLLRRRGVAEGVPLDTSDHRKSIPSYEHLLGQTLYPAPLARILVSEVCSFCRRIREILNTKLYRRGVVCDPGSQLTSDRQERERLQDGCNVDRRNLLTARPWLTLADAEIFCLGWKQGVEFSFRNCDTQFLSSKQPASENLTDSKVPELTKHDL